jgi:ankyrin repeat protein
MEAPVTQLPAAPDLSHLKKQAKHLLRDALAGGPVALTRFAETLPVVRTIGIEALAQHELKLHDAQSVIAREYGFLSWTELKRYVEWKQIDHDERLKSWLKWTYEGNARERRLAVRMLREEPEFFQSDPWLACATGDAAAVEATLIQDKGWANRRGGPLNMPPLVAVTHSKLILENGFETGLLHCARLLPEHGADVDSSWTDARFPDSPLSALYGAAGKSHHIAMTQLLLDANANPNDNESLYHSIEAPDPACTHLLLAAGARVVGTNAIGRVLDYDKLDILKLLLQHGGDATEQPWVHSAITRGRSIEHIQVLINAGADLRATDKNGVNVYALAQSHGRSDVLALLHNAGIQEPLSEEERFVAACARGDEAEARTILTRVPEILSRLSDKQLRAMPDLAWIQNHNAVRTMLALGWPREVKSGWGATALNMAVFQGDAEMADLLLEHGADWRTPHGYGDNVVGTLSYASQAEDIDDGPARDCVGCARALITHGMPLPDSEHYTFSSEVTEYFDSLRLKAG